MYLLRSGLVNLCSHKYLTETLVYPFFLPFSMRALLRVTAVHLSPDKSWGTPREGRRSIAGIVSPTYKHTHKFLPRKLWEI